MDSYFTSKMAAITKNDEKFGDWMRDFYNKKAKNISSKGYEHARWFSSPEKIRQYKFSCISLTHHMKHIKFKDCLEIGCGPGTWTKFLLERYPKAKFTCLDISREMIRQHRANVKSNRVKRIVKSFLDESFKKKFDFIFFSRSIEYIPNKPKVIEKLNSLLKPGGKCIIVTSPPHPTFFAIKKVLGKKIDREHTQRISVYRLNRLLKSFGFTNREFYPILFTDSFLVPTGLFFRMLYRKRWGLLSHVFASGYLVKFEKPK